MARVLRLGAPLCALSIALSASAGTAPKPSQLVTAFTVGAACSTDPEGAMVNTMRTLAVAEAPFAIPPKQVLVITHVEITLGGATADTEVNVRLVAPTAGLLFETRVHSSATGDASASVDLPTGVAVRSGTEICTNSSDGNTLGVVHGYFAKDR
jgi:hypothetical protein